jgi:hypothetical protein
MSRLRSSSSRHASVGSEQDQFRPVDWDDGRTTSHLRKMAMRQLGGFFDIAGFRSFLLWLVLFPRGPHVSKPINIDCLQCKKGIA